MKIVPAFLSLAAMVLLSVSIIVKEDDDKATARWWANMFLAISLLNLSAC